MNASDDVIYVFELVGKLIILAAKSHRLLCGTIRTEKALSSEKTCVCSALLKAVTVNPIYAVL